MRAWSVGGVSMDGMQLRIRQRIFQAFEYAAPELPGYLPSLRLRGIVNTDQIRCWSG
jgi:hypothetical protein